MNVTKNDIFYILMSVAVASIGVVAVSNTNTKVGLYGLVGLLGIAVVLAIIIRPSLGANILAITVFTNFSTLLVNQGFPGVMKPLVAIVAFALLVRYMYVGQAPVWHPKTVRVEVFLLIYFMVVTASFFVASYQDRALEQVLDLGKDLVIVYCIIFALREPRHWKQTIWLIIITTALLSLLSIYQLVSHDYQQNFFGLSSVSSDKVLLGDSAAIRVRGPIDDPNFWGQILVAVSTLLVFRIMHEKHIITKLAAILMMGIISYAVLNTYSRGAYLVLAIDLALILFVFGKHTSRMAAFAGMGILILLIPFLPSSYLGRFSTLTAFTNTNGIYQDSSFRGRTSEALTGVTMFTYHPILGVGAANYRPNYQHYTQLVGIEFRTESRDAHSLYVEVLAETGSLGIIAFFGMVFFLFDALNKAIRALERAPWLHDWLPWMSAIRMAVLSYLLTSIFLHNDFIRYFWILVAMALAGIHITYNLLNNSEKSTPSRSTVD